MKTISKMIASLLLMTLISCEGVHIEQTHGIVKGIRQNSIEPGKYIVEVDMQIEVDGESYYSAFIHTDKKYSIGDTIYIR